MNKHSLCVIPDKGALRRSFWRHAACTVLCLMALGTVGAAPATTALERAAAKHVFIAPYKSTPPEPFFLKPGDPPLGKWRVVRRDGQGTSMLEAGTWRGTVPARFRVVAARTETIYVTSGKLIIETEDGDKFELLKGDSASFDKGSVAYWTIVGDDYEEFFIFTP